MSHPKAASNQRRLWIILGGVLLAIVAAVGVLAQQQTGGADAATKPSESSEAGTPSAGEEEPPALSSLARRDADDPQAMGAVDAPVVLIEYADLRCTYCGLFASETLPEIVSEYVDSGKLRVEWHDAPVLGGSSPQAAIAQSAASAQGKFWEFNAAIYATGSSSKTEWTTESLIELAGTIDGLDVEAFTAELTNPKHEQLVSERAQQATQIGVRATPTFIVGDQVVQGAQPLEAMRTVIDEELQRAGA